MSLHLTWAMTRSKGSREGRHKVQNHTNSLVLPIYVSNAIIPQNAASNPSVTIMHHPMTSCRRCQRSIIHLRWHALLLSHVHTFYVVDGHLPIVTKFRSPFTLLAKGVCLVNFTAYAFTLWKKRVELELGITHTGSCESRRLCTS